MLSKPSKSASMSALLWFLGSAPVAAAVVAVVSSSSSEGRNNGRLEAREGEVLPDKSPLGVSARR